MRHFAQALRERKGWQVDYVELDDPNNSQSLAAELRRQCAKLKPERVVMVEAGDWRVEQALVRAAADAGVEFDLREDRHFMSTRREFAEHAKGRKTLRLEYFYRELRRRHEILLDANGEPEGGQWNYDADNRESFGKAGPVGLRPPSRFTPDDVTRAVMVMVQQRFPKHPGSLDAFDWPVTREQACDALADFVAHRLAHFGRHQDAMWTDEPWLYHSRIAAAMNLKLISPREVIAAVVKAYREGAAPLAATEGFVRQVLGWREYVRGLYWLEMPAYADCNALGAHEALPDFYWTGACEMRCLRQAVGQTLAHGYAHHIQRLMVTGLYGLMLGVDPRRMHEWYLSVYVDAVEWVELPNTIGMSQFADGGRLASKPYVATGKYIQRMSNYCAGCRFDPAEATGANACPFTTLYWDFLARHEARLRGNARMHMQLRNLDRLSPERRAEISRLAASIRALGGMPPKEGAAQAELTW